MTWNKEKKAVIALSTATGPTPQEQYDASALAINKRLLHAPEEDLDQIFAEEVKKAIAYLQGTMTVFTDNTFDTLEDWDRKWGYLFPDLLAELGFQYWLLEKVTAIEEAQLFGQHT